METSISDLRKDLAAYVSRARKGEDVLITDRGIPVAKLTHLASESTVEKIEQLTRDGVLLPAKGEKRPIDRTTLVKPRGPGLVSDWISENRR